MADIFKKVEALAKTYKMIDEPVFIRTGSIVLDALLGGGIPRGTFILWSSGAGIGKSTAALHICRSYCSQGLKVLYLDYEGGVNDNQLRGIGVSRFMYDPKKNPSGNLFIFRAYTFADAEEFLDSLLDEVDLVVFDSITAMLPERMKEGSVEDITPGAQARLMSNLMRKYKARTLKANASWLMINQTRMKISFIGKTVEDEAGGQAVKFYSDIRILMKEDKKKKLETEEETPTGVVKVPYGAVNTVWCVKSRFTRPFIPLNLTIVFGKGISNLHAYRDFLEYKGFIRRPNKATKYEVELEPGKSSKFYDREVTDYLRDNIDTVRKIVKENGGYKLLMNQEPVSFEQIPSLGADDGDIVVQKFDTNQPAGSEDIVVDDALELGEEIEVGDSSDGSGTVEN